MQPGKMVATTQPMNGYNQPGAVYGQNLPGMIQQPMPMQGNPAIYN